ncbi:hypothetical protein Cpir12675_002144 [Ceratocystis pirilliformis]|uniref:Uncharacterized protein n=1 Tax=Ceratocystis pirilliformis TaxID=259994 RepID=A0ABR3ZAW8_9PEZI
MIVLTKSGRRLLVLIIAFCIFVLVSIFHGPIVITSATQAVQEWGWSNAPGSGQTAPQEAQVPDSDVPDEIYTEDDSYVEVIPELTLAPEVKASEMMARPIASRLGTVPKIFHQSWIDSNLPIKFQQWSENCRRVHHDYEWVLWTNEDNKNLVKKHFPWLLEAYISLPSEIYRSDLARNLYMYIFGGVYADLDTECLRSSNVIFANYSTPYDTAAHVAVSEDVSPNRMAFFGRMGTDKQFEHSIPNAWMASTPSHPFFLIPLESVLNRFNRAENWTDLPEDVTGPVALRQAILKYRKHYAWQNSPEALEQHMERHILAGPYKKSPDLEHTVQLLHHNVIYPFSWGPDNYDVSKTCWVLQDTYNSENCKKALQVESKGSVSITYWSHTHSPTGHNEENIKFITKEDRKRSFRA